jgi:MOSC domain-containing protein YiiM
VTVLGIIGDAHRDPMHGGPDAALCLFSLEVIEALRREGHPIYPGSTGENITTVGLDWAAMKPGVRLRLGDEVEIELTGYTKPCGTIAGSFRGGKFSRVSHHLYPRECRLYARVVKEGRIRVGDRIEVLSPPAAVEGSSQQVGTTA